jgi:hypothetical protein
VLNILRIGATTVALPDSPERATSSPTAAPRLSSGWRTPSSWSISEIVKTTTMGHRATDDLPYDEVISVIVRVGVQRATVAATCGCGWARETAHVGDYERRGSTSRSGSEGGLSWRGGSVIGGSCKKQAAWYYGAAAAGVQGGVRGSEGRVYFLFYKKNKCEGLNEKYMSR